MFMTIILIIEYLECCSSEKKYSSYQTSAAVLRIEPGAMNAVPCILAHSATTYSFYFLSIYYLFIVCDFFQFQVNHN